jgi:spore coat protein A
MKQFRQKLHPQLPPTVLWGYDGIYPGPTIEARQGVPVQVNWRSYLPTTHFLPVDHTIHGAGTDVPDVRTVVHLHGHKSLPESDGYPEAWFTSDGKTGPDFIRDLMSIPTISARPCSGITITGWGLHA